VDSTPVCEPCAEDSGEGALDERRAKEERNLWLEEYTEVRRENVELAFDGCLGCR
jgi:hypothetical protein